MKKHNTDDEETKKFQEMFEKSVDKWLEKKYSQFGKWTLGLIGVGIFMGVMQMIAWFNGYQKVPDISMPKDIKTGMHP